MRALKIIPHYLMWHYSAAITDFTRLSRNFFSFIIYFFSIPVLLRTLFSPWQRMGEQYHKGNGLESFASTIVVNTIMRVIGFGMRSVLIVVGIVSFALYLVCAVLAFVLWFALPVLVGGSSILGILYIIT
jgi:hypothetical protein